MKKADIIRKLSESGIDNLYGKTLSMVDKRELESLWRTMQESEIRHLSVWQAQMYLKCGLQWHFRYVQGLKIPPSGAAVVGRSGHRALEYDFKELKKSGRHEPKDTILDVFDEVFKVEKEGADFRKEKPEDAHKSGRGALDLYCDGEDGQFKEMAPVEIEEPFEINLFDGISLKGIVDVIDENVGILDFKMAGKKMPQGDFDDNFQLAVYSHAKKVNQVAVDVMIRTKTPKIQVFRGKTTRAKRNRALNYLGYVADGIKRKVYLPPPSGSWICSKDWCGYWEICQKELAK